LQKEMAIAIEDTSVTLAPRMAAIGAELMIETLRGLQSGSVRPQKQDDSQATLAPVLKKEDGKIDFSRSAQEIFNRFRGFQAWPGAFTSFRGKGLSITAMRPVSEEVRPLQLFVKGGQLFAGCGDSRAIELLEVQPEGKKRISAKDFVHGYRPVTGENIST
jgi:methionyl-tRNA formyltransferase